VLLDGEFKLCLCENTSKKDAQGCFHLDQCPWLFALTNSSVRGICSHEKRLREMEADPLLGFLTQVLVAACVTRARLGRVEGGYVDASLVTEATLIDLMLLAQCEVFVGGFASQMSR